MKSPRSRLHMPFIGMSLMSRHLRRDAAVHSLNRVGDDVVTGLLAAVPGDVLLGSQASRHIDREAFRDGVQRGDSLIAFPCRHGVPGGLYHRLSVAVLVGEIRGHGKMSYPRVSNPENVIRNLFPFIIHQYYSFSLIPDCTFIKHHP